MDRPETVLEAWNFYRDAVRHCGGLKIDDQSAEACFYAGAMSTLTLLRDGATQEELKKETLGRVILQMAPHSIADLPH